MNTCEEDAHNTESSDQMLSCSNACYMRHIGVSNSECLGHCDRHGQSGCHLTTQDVRFSMCSSRDSRGSLCGGTASTISQFRVDCAVGCESYPDEGKSQVSSLSQKLSSCKKSNSPKRGQQIGKDYLKKRFPNTAFRRGMNVLNNKK